MLLPSPDRFVTLPDGRRIGVDDRGDPDGSPVLFFHGTPDTRVARHPDDGIATALGVRLVAADRPGLGSSDVDPGASPTTVADDHAAVLDDLDVERASVLAWSAGAISALAFASRHPRRVRRLTLVAPLVPADAYGDPDVLDGADESRRLFAQVLETSSPDDAARELAPWLVPPDVDEATARALLAESLARVSHVVGAADALVAALVGSVQQGMTGLEREIAAQGTRLGAVLDHIDAPGAVHAGRDDRVTPPTMAHWVGRRLGLRVHVHDGESHAVAVNRWSSLLAEAAGTPPV